MAFKRAFTDAEIRYLHQAVFDRYLNFKNEWLSDYVIQLSSIRKSIVNGSGDEDNRLFENKAEKCIIEDKLKIPYQHNTIGNIRLNVGFSTVKDDVAQLWNVFQFISHFLILDIKIGEFDEYCTEDRLIKDIDRLLGEIDKLTKR